LPEQWSDTRLWNTCSVGIRWASYKIDTQYFAQRMAIILNAYVLGHLYDSTAERVCMLQNSCPLHISVWIHNRPYTKRARKRSVKCVCSVKVRDVLFVIKYHRNFRISRRIEETEKYVLNYREQTTSNYRYKHIKSNIKSKHLPVPN
jgi:hypothetical protein